MSDPKPSDDPFWAELGYSDERCPACNVRMKITSNGRGLICLNACALDPISRAMLNAGLKAAYDAVKGQSDAE